MLLYAIWKRCMNILLLCLAYRFETNQEWVKTIPLSHDAGEVTEMGLRAVQYLQHVVDDVEFYDRLTPDQVVHHGVIHIMHHDITQNHDETLQNITHLSRLQDTRSTAHTHTHEKKHLHVKLAP